MHNYIFGNENYYFELEQLSQKAQYNLMKDCNSYRCYYIFNLIYSEIKKLDSEDYCKNNQYIKNYYLYDNKKVAIISTGEFRYLLKFTAQEVRRAIQRLQEKGYIELILLDYRENSGDIYAEFDATQIYISNKYGYAITEKGYKLINNLEI